MKNNKNKEEMQNQMNINWYIPTYGKLLSKAYK